MVKKESSSPFYSKDRWQNWLTRVGEENLDPESETFARLYFNLQNDTTIAIAKIITAAENGYLDEEEALNKLEFINDIVLAEPEFDAENKLLLIDSVQTSLIPVFYAAEEYLIGGAVEEQPLDDNITDAVTAAAEEDEDAALAYLVQAGTQIIDGTEFDGSEIDGIDSWLASEWLNGLDSLQDAWADPEVKKSASEEGVQDLKAESNDTGEQVSHTETTTHSKNNTTAHQSPQLNPDEIPAAPDVTFKYENLVDEETIGRGGNADVWKAKLPTSGENVTLAIKEPRMGGTVHTETAERILNEAKKWDQLDSHDHIVSVVDYGTDGIPWIAMEYMDGGHLNEKGEKMGLPQALWTSVMITKGVRHAHRQGVAHLDLKPENILFRSVEDMWDVPKVADWGLSKNLLKHSKSVEGLSTQYAAPEQFDEDLASVDEITDIYQLGAIFYELFTGQPPFTGGPAKVMNKVLHKEPESPSDIANLPKRLDEILLKALSKEKEKRYEDILYLRDELQDVQSGL